LLPAVLRTTFSAKNQLDGPGGFPLASFLISTVEIVWSVSAISQTAAIR